MSEKYDKYNYRFNIYLEFIWKQRSNPDGVFGASLGLRKRIELNPVASVR
jgi:hypothetical protein